MKHMTGGGRPKKQKQKHALRAVGDNIVKFATDKQIRIDMKQNHQQKNKKTPAASSYPDYLYLLVLS
jgi:hypothetical protein